MHGFIAIDKPPGPTSARVTNLVRHSFSERVSVGHAGTLDPIASGVLMVGINAATRFIGYLPKTKKYEVECQLGVRTTTYDSEGEVVAKTDVPSDFVNRLHNILPNYVGLIDQVAPPFSALKYKGRPLYEYARKGISVPRKERKVEISDLRLLKHEAEGKLTMAVSCGPGTYMRSLVDDLGEALGCGAMMTGLRRTSCCGVNEKDAVKMPTSGWLADELATSLRSSGDFLSHLPIVVVSSLQLTQLIHGQVPNGKFDGDGVFRIRDGDGGFHGLGKIANGSLSVVRLMPQANHVSQKVA